MVLVHWRGLFDIRTGENEEKSNQDREIRGIMFNQGPSMFLFPCSGHWYDGASFLSRQDVSARAVVAMDDEP